MMLSVSLLLVSVDCWRANSSPSTRTPDEVHQVEESALGSCLAHVVGGLLHDSHGGQVNMYQAFYTWLSKDLVQPLNTQLVSDDVVVKVDLLLHRGGPVCGALVGRIGDAVVPDAPLARQECLGPVVRLALFTRPKIAVFLDSCFWHSCPEHGRKPTVNDWYWGPKLARTVERDRQADAALRSAGWTTLRFWRHDDLNEAAWIVVEALARVRPETSPSERGYRQGRGRRSR
jgi:hypothetical protein